MIWGIYIPASTLGVVCLQSYLPRLVGMLDLDLLSADS